MMACKQNLLVKYGNPMNKPSYSTFYLTFVNKQTA